MNRSIATRTGDDGTTSLLYGQRVPKDHPQVEAVGTLDELNAALGAVKPQLAPDERGRAIHALITSVQKNLVAVMGEVACAEADAPRYADSTFEKLLESDLKRLDDAVAGLEARGLNFSGWATPGANHRSAALEIARVTARRAERRLVTVASQGRIMRPVVPQFINRLSDLLWLLAREAEAQG